MVLPDSSATHPLPIGAGGKWKFFGPVNFVVQAGNHNVATPTAADNTKAGQRQGSAATAPGATASTSTKQAGPSVWLFVLVAVGSVVVWEFFSRKVPAAWLPWRVRPG